MTVTPASPAGSAAIGYARSVAGRFTLYDLAPGSYALRAIGPRGSGAATVAVAGGKVARVTVRVR